MLRLEVIDFIDQTNQSLVARVPESGTAAIQYGAQLIVQQNQEAVFFRDGRAMDTFGPGRHTLTTANVPILTKILTSPWQKSPFQACVYFVGKQTFLDQRWGTRQPITLRDKDFGMVRLRGFGKFAYRVADASLLINSVVGTQGRLTTEEVIGYLRDTIVSSLTDLLASSGIPLLDLPMKFDEISAAARLKLSSDFALLGLELIQFMVSNISPPEEVQKAIDARSSMAAVGDLRSYTIFQAANGMAAAGQNAGSAGMGMGVGLGMVIPNVVQQALQSNAAPSSAPVATPTTTNPAASRIDFSSLQPAAAAPTPKDLILNLSKQNGWTVQPQGEGLELVVPLGSLRRQRLMIELDKKDGDGHALISIWTSCGTVQQQNAMSLLRYNDQLVHGAFALRRQGDAELLVLRENLIADTADPLEITKAISAIAWQADQVEQQLTGMTDQL
ncbi:MAG: SPFH domain-containing protein [Pirellulales bacterium]